MVRQPRRPPDFVVVGRITRPHGIRGEVRVIPVDVPAERLLELDAAYVRPGGEGERVRREVRRARVATDCVLIAFSGIDSRDAAETLRGAWVEIPGSQVKPLPEDEYYVFELIGCRVYTVEGDEVGEVADVLPTGANDVYVVKRPGKRDVLVPAVKVMVKDVDVDARRIVIDPWPGLLDDEG